MSSEKVIKNVEDAIHRICSDIKEKKGGSGSDKIESLSKLLNSYSRLLERSKGSQIDYTENGDPNYYKELLKNEKKEIRRGILR